MDDLKRILGKIKKVKLLRDNAPTDAEREAAESALQRLHVAVDLCKVNQKFSDDEEIELKASAHDIWSRKLFLALLAKHGIRPYRKPGQRKTTIRVRGRKSLLVDVIWPEFCKLDKLLRKQLEETTERLINESVGKIPDYE